MMMMMMMIMMMMMMMMISKEIYSGYKALSIFYRTYLKETRYDSHRGSHNLNSRYFASVKDLNIILKGLILEMRIGTVKM